MTSIELKEKLISKIQITDDKDILEGVLKLLQFELNSKEAFYLSETQKESIVLSKKQIKEGKIYSEEEADQLTDKWLNE